MIRIKRVYDEPSREDGVRVLIDRLWPRGLSREKARINYWLRDIAPSDELRRWFNHDPSRWEEFKVRYWHELNEKKKVVNELLNLLRSNPVVTLLYSAKDPVHNNAVALREYLMIKYGVT